MTSYYIGIDIGASFIKGALFDLKGLKVRNVFKYSSPTSSLSAKNDKPMRFEVNCDLYEKIVRKIISKLLSIEKNVEGIVFSSQMHGMVLVDSNLNPITPFIGWQDERLHELTSENKTWLDVLNKKLEKTDISKNGIEFRTGLMGSTLFWLKENEIFKKNKNAKALFLGDYIATKLSKGSLMTHSTNACGSGLYNVEKDCWDKKILKALGIDESFLPKVALTGERIGYFENKSKKVPIFVAIGDLQAAILGSLIGLEKNRDVCINIGTGSQVSSISSFYCKGEHDVRSYFDSTFLNTVTFIPAGRALSVMINFIEDIGKTIFNRKEKNIWEKLIKLSSNKKEANGLKADVSYYKNSISDHIAGSFSNITENNFTIGNLFFSFLERMADNYFIAYKRLGNVKKTDRIICSGGLGRKLLLLRKLMQKKFDKKIILSPFEEETLAGLFILSLVCRKDFSTVRDASFFIHKNKLRFV